MVAMNIVITGGSGFVGSYLCEKLINDGHKIIAVSYTHLTLPTITEV